MATEIVDKKVEEKQPPTLAPDPPVEPPLEPLALLDKKKEEIPDKTPVEIMVEVVEPVKGKQDEALLHELKDIIATFPTMVKELQSEIVNLKQGFKEVRDTSQSTLDNHLEEFDTKIHQLTEQLYDSQFSLTKHLAEFQNKITQQVVQSHNTLDQNIASRMEIERKLNEEREKEILAGLKRAKTQNSSGNGMMNFFPFIGQLFSKKKHSNHEKRGMNFESLERLIRLGRMKREKIKEALELLILDLNIDAKNKNKEVWEIIQKVKDRLESERSEFISVFAREYLLTQLDKAQILYRKMHHETQKPTPKELLMMCENLIKRLYTGPIATLFKESVRDLRKTLLDADPDFNPSLIKEIRAMESELLAIGNVQLTYLHQNKYRTQLITWKHLLERVLGKAGHKGSIYELSEMISKIIIRINSLPMANELRNQFGEFRAVLMPSDFLLKNSITKECDEIELSLVQKGLRRITSIERDTFKRTLIAWKKEFDAIRQTTTAELFGTFITWMDAIIENKDNKVEKGTFKLLLMLKKQEGVLKQAFRTLEARTEYGDFLEELEKNIYDSITVERAKHYKNIFERWNQQTIESREG